MQSATSSRSRSRSSGSHHSDTAGGAPSAKVKTTPLPKMKILACSAVFLSEAMCCCVLFPFVGLYVAHLQHISIENAGYFSGVLVGLFMLGQVISSKLWGWVSDVYGRKVPLTIGLMAGALATFFFGISPNLYFCCLMRFLHGVFNGNVLIAKIIVSDVTDSTNAAMGFSTIGLLWCVGAVIGPAIGGLLYDPLNNPQLQWLHVQPGSFLSKYPAFLPSLFLFVYTSSTCVLCSVVLPETNRNRTKSLRNVPVLGWFLNYFRPKKVIILDEVESYPAATGKDDTEEEDRETHEEGSSRRPKGKRKKRSRRGSRSSIRTPCPAVVSPPMTYRQALADPVIRNITLLYMCVSAGDIFFNEVLPLWAISSAASGGLAMFSDEVGMLMLLFSVPTFFANLFFARIYKAVHNPNRMWAVGGVLFILAILIVPYGSHLTGWTCFFYIFLLGSVKNCMGSTLFNIVHLQTAKAAPPGTVGSVYGISQSFSYLVRTVVPFIAAPAYAWSVSTTHTFPFNHYFTFIIFMIPMVLGVYITMVGRIERTEEELRAWVEGDFGAPGTTTNTTAIVVEERRDGEEEGQEKRKHTTNIPHRKEKSAERRGSEWDSTAPARHLEKGTVGSDETPSVSHRHPTGTSGHVATHYAGHPHYHYGCSTWCPHSYHTVQGLPAETFSALVDDRSLGASFAMSAFDAKQLMEPSDPYRQFQSEYEGSEHSGEESSDTEDEEAEVTMEVEHYAYETDMMRTGSFSGENREDEEGGPSGVEEGEAIALFTGVTRGGGGAESRRGWPTKNRGRGNRNRGKGISAMPRTPASRFPPLQRGWLATQEARVEKEDERIVLDNEEEGELRQPLP